MVALAVSTVSAKPVQWDLGEVEKALAVRGITLDKSNVVLQNVGDIWSDCGTVGSERKCTAE